MTFTDSIRGETRIRQIGAIVLVALAVVVVASGAGPFAAMGGLMDADHGGQAGAEDIGTWSHNNTKNAHGDHEYVKGVAIEKNGTRMYIPDSGFTQKVFQYELSTPYNISTASKTKSMSVSDSVSVAFNPDGTKMYRGDGGDGEIVEYVLSDPYNITTASRNLRFSSAGNPAGLAFGKGGERMYVATFNGDSIIQYNLTTAYDLSTATQHATVAAQTVAGVTINGDGTRLYGGAGTDQVDQYNLETPWEVSTATHVGTHSQPADVSGIDMKSDGTKFYIASNGPTEIRSYDSTVYPDLNGTVEDDSGEALTDAKVSVENTSDGTTTKLTVNSSGFYEAGFEAGEYDVTVYNTSYANETKTVDVPAGGTTVDFSLSPPSSSGYTQEFVLDDNTGNFPNGSTFDVDAELKQFGITTPAGSDDWTDIEETNFNSFGRAYVELTDGTLYRLTVEYGNAVYYETGYNASDNNEPYTVEIGEPGNETTPTPTGEFNLSSLEIVECAGPDNDNLCIRYDGELVDALDYNITGPDGSTVYNFNRTFDEPVEYVEWEMNESLDNTSATDPSDYEIEYAGEFADENATTFNGTAGIGEDISIFGDGATDSESTSGGGGGAGGGFVPADSGSGAPVWATAAVPVAALAFIVYRRRTQGGGL